MSDDLGFDLDLGVDGELQVDIEVPATVREAFGVEELTLTDEGDVLEFEDNDSEVGSDDELALTDSVLIKTSDSIVETMTPYAASVR